MKAIHGYPPLFFSSHFLRDPAKRWIKLDCHARSRDLKSVAQLEIEIKGLPEAMHRNGKPKGQVRSIRFGQARKTMTRKIGGQRWRGVNPTLRGRGVFHCSRTNGTPGVICHLPLPNFMQRVEVRGVNPRWSVACVCERSRCDKASAATGAGFGAWPPVSAATSASPKRQLPARVGWLPFGLFGAYPVFRKHLQDKKANVYHLLGSP